MLTIKKLNIFQCEECQDGTLFVVGVDRDCMARLTKTEGRLFIVSKALYIKVGKTPIGKTQPNAPTREANTKLSKVMDQMKGEHCPRMLRESQ